MDDAVEPPRGTYSARVDEKGRLKMPADFERLLGPHATWFLTSFDERTVRIYPAKEWERVQNALQSSEGKPLLFRANDVGGEAEIDNQGRLLRPAELRRKAQMENTPVRLSLLRDHIQVVTEEQD